MDESTHDCIAGDRNILSADPSDHQITQGISYNLPLIFFINFNRGRLITPYFYVLMFSFIVFELQ